MVGCTLADATHLAHRHDKRNLVVIVRRRRLFRVVLAHAQPPRAIPLHRLVIRAIAYTHLLAAVPTMHQLTRERLDSILTSQPAPFVAAVRAAPGVARVALLQHSTRKKIAKSRQFKEIVYVLRPVDGKGN